MNTHEGDPPREPSRRIRPVRLKWPDHELLVRERLESISAERITDTTPVLFRSALIELQTGDIVIEPTTGLPQLTGGLHSHAYRLGGWRDIVLSYIQRGQDLNTFIADSDAVTEDRGVPSPFIWTTADPRYALSFGPTPQPEQMSPDQVFLVLKPDKARFRLTRDPDGNFSTEQSIEFRQAMGERRPYLLKLPDIPQGQSLAETLLGPYISKSEIPALILVKNDQREDFLEIIEDIFPPSQ